MVKTTLKFKMVDGYFDIKVTILLPLKVVPKVVTRDFNCL